MAGYSTGQRMRDRGAGASSPAWRSRQQPSDWSSRSSRSSAGLPETFLAARHGRPIVDSSTSTATESAEIDPSRYIPASSGPHYLRPLNGPTGPSDAYCAVASEPSHAKEVAVPGQRPQLIVLDLNGTLCVRPERNAMGARNVFLRPYASSFLEYLLGYDVVEGTQKKRFTVMVWSSAQPKSVSILLKSLGLASECAEGEEGSGFERYDGLSMPFLEAVWDRHSFGLTQEEFYERTATIKDLEKVWRDLRWSLGYTGSSEGVEAEANIATDRSWTQYDTILINDVTHSAIAQPHNLLQVREFRFTAEELETYSKLPLKQRASGSAVYDAPEASKEDTVLLQVVGTLEALRRQSNISAVLREGKFAAPDEPRSDEEWESQGRRVLESKGITISKSFDPEWSIRVEKVGVL